MPNDYHQVVELLRRVENDLSRHGRDQDLRRATFTRNDVEEIALEDDLLSFRLKGGRSWKGSPDDLRWAEIFPLLEAAEVKAVEQDLGLGRAETPSGNEEPEMRRVYLAEGESGWVELLNQSGLVRIANIPYEGRFNIDDVVQSDVEAMREDPRQVLKGTIETRVFPVRTILTYSRLSDFKKISKMVKKLGGKMEGAIGPSKHSPGFISLAAKSTADVLKIVRDLEIPQDVDKGWEPNFLESLDSQ